MVIPKLSQDLFQRRTDVLRSEHSAQNEPRSSLDTDVFAGGEEFSSKRHIGHIGRGILDTFQASASAFSLQDAVVSYHPGFPAIILLNPEAMNGHSLRKTDEKVGNIKLELSDCACFSVSEE